MKKNTHICFISAVAWFSNSAESKEVNSLLEGFNFKTPFGFEDILHQEPTPTELFYLNKKIGDGAVVITGDGEKRYRSGKNELDLNRVYLCSSSPIIRNVVIDEQICNQLSFTLYEKYEDRILLVYLQPDNGSIMALNRYFGIKSENSAVINEREHIGPSSVDAVSGRIQHNTSFTEGDRSNGSLSLNTMASYKEYLFEVEPIVERYNARNSFNVGKLFGSKTYAGTAYGLGFSSFSNNNLIKSSTGIIPSRSMVGGWYSSTSKTFRNKQQGAGSPILVFMPFTGLIEVYRDNQLLFVTRATAGMTEIPVIDFPIGVYDVSILRRSLSGEELEPITDTVANSLTNDGFMFALGMMNSGKNQVDVFDGDYDNLAAGFAYQSKITDYVNGSFSIINIDTKQYFQPTISYKPSSSLSTMLSSEVNIQDMDLGIDFRTNYSDELLGKRINGNLNYRYSDLPSVESHSYYFNASLMPDLQYSKLLMINAQLSKSRAHQYTSEYSELNIENRHAVSVFGTSASLSASLGTSSNDDLLATLSLSFNIGSRKDYSLDTNFTYSGQRQSPSGEVILSKKGLQDINLSDLTFITGGSEEFVRLGAEAGFEFESARANLGSFVYQDFEQGTSNNHLFGSVSGNMYFSGTEYAFDRKGASSGVIVKMDTQPGENINAQADVSGRGSVKLKKNNTFVNIPSFTESSLYLNSSNAVIDDYRHDYTLYKGNYAFLSIEPRQTFEAAGYISFEEFAGERITLKNHESMITIKNHESTVKVPHNNKEEYFQLQVSRKYPVIEILDMQGSSLCKVNIGEQLMLSKSQDFLYLGKIGCNLG